MKYEISLCDLKLCFLKKIDGGSHYSNYYEETRTCLDLHFSVAVFSSTTLLSAFFLVQFTLTKEEGHRLFF